MKRLVIERFVEWKNQPRRKPLIVRGARQVGKTWAIKYFGENYFQGKIHVVDLEKRPDWHSIFEGNLIPTRIISELEILLNTKIIPGQDLLFFDEVQSCPRALMALRYFYEEMPELHIIAAGSLMEFAMREISFPVGRVQFLNIYPLSFTEFLMATGKSLAAEIIQSKPGPQPASIHQMMLEELRQYFFIGGMPECVLAYVETGKIREAFDVQSELVNAYRQDFSKYAPYSDKNCLNAVLSSVAQRVGQQIKYVHLAEGYTSPTIKKAFELLNLAQVIRKISSTNPSGLLLGASASATKFKALMVDIGIMQHLCGIPANVEYTKTDLLGIHQGALAEQFVGQELIANGQNELYYWSRAAKSSSAEVDILGVFNNKIYPIEIKSGPSGRLKSLHLFLETYPNCRSGFVLSTAPYSELPEQKLIFIPIYFAGALNKMENDSNTPF